LPQPESHPCARATLGVEREQRSKRSAIESAATRHLRPLNRSIVREQMASLPAASLIENHLSGKYHQYMQKDRTGKHQEWGDGQQPIPGSQPRNPRPKPAVRRVCRLENRSNRSNDRSIRFGNCPMDRATPRSHQPFSPPVREAALGDICSRGDPLPEQLGAHHTVCACQQAVRSLDPATGLYFGFKFFRGYPHNDFASRLPRSRFRLPHR